MVVRLDLLEQPARDELDQLLAAGTLPVNHDQKELAEGRMPKGFSTPEEALDARPLLMGQAAGAITDKDLVPAVQIVDSMIDECVDMMNYNVGRFSRL